MGKVQTIEKLSVPEAIFRKWRSSSGIFYIREYLGVTPSEFFDIDSKNPARPNDVIRDLKRLNDKQLETIATLIKDIVKD